MPVDPTSPTKDFQGRDWSILNLNDLSQTNVAMKKHNLFVRKYGA